MHPITKPLLLSLATYSLATPLWADNITDLQAELLKMRQEYEQRITQLENRLAAAEQQQEKVLSPVISQGKKQSSTEFNPAISLVLNGQINDYENNPEDYSIHGFAIPGEGGLASEGGSLGESELIISANIDQNLYGQATLALHEEDGSTEVEMEEAYIETIGLNNGLTIRAGRYFAPISYLNEKHIHAWNFSDAPLIYRGLFGNQLSTDGIKLSYLLPIEQYTEVGASLGNGTRNPSAGGHNGIGDWLVYAKTGGDFDLAHSWQFGGAYWQSTPQGRNVGAAHAHAGETTANPVQFTGKTQISNLSFVYKWTPEGYSRPQFTLLSEYFYLKDDGQLSHDAELADYSGRQYGGFTEGLYRLSPTWQTGVRYDYLGSRLTASDTELLDDAGLDFTNYSPKRYGLMLEWLPSEFSRIRAQVNHDKASRQSDTQFILQYTVSLGAHGAHSY